MKLLKKLMVVFVAVLMVMSLTSKVYAEGNTITVEGAKEGETYSIYKMLDLSVNEDTPPTAFRYTINTTWSGFWSGPGSDYIDKHTSGTETYVTWKENKDDAASMEAFAKAAVAYAKENNIKPNKDSIEVADGGTATWTDLENGYYLVTSTYGIAASVASTPANPAQTISEKNNENTTDKQVKEATERNGAEESWAKENDAAVGDTVYFRSKVSIAKNSVKVKYHDTMTEGLTWTGTGSTKVYTDADLSTELPATNYSVAAGTGGETFVVTFTDEYVAGLTAASTDVYVGYSAVLNNKAVVATGQINTGKVTWGNNGESNSTTTETKTHEFQILKYDGADSSKNPLADAKFQLFTIETGGTPLTLAKNATGNEYRIVDSESTLPEGFTLTTDNKIVTLATGTIKIIGVDSDNYYLEETDAPTSYTKLEGRTKVIVNADNSLVTEIANKSGAVLPSTGGIGTTIFHIAGAALILGAGILLISKKRMNNN